ncbi:hypothetical protein DEJ47_19530 [Streptomyces venezuelae]|uniref:Uncharacterized protein n=1 Tax=Streptomyces venezuelae TaxID=54571 RepID=A0A5P2BGQ4_STRVZ|nr:hypothetical protein DEJ47_19530 [Streptomyces venezuelae]
MIGVTAGEAAYLDLIARRGVAEREFAEKLRGDGGPETRTGDSERVREETFTHGLQRVSDGPQARLDSTAP